jgi:hypothetical protein
LIEQYGFDTKYAGHVLRLGYQGIEFLETGALTLPMPEPERQRILAVRTGSVPFEEVLAEADELRSRLEELVRSSPLPEHADDAAVNAFLAGTYRAWWASRA